MATAVAKFYRVSFENCQFVSKISSKRADNVLSFGLLILKMIK